MRIKIPKADLECMYIKDRMTLVEISKQTGIPRTTLTRWFHEYGIPIADQRIDSIVGQRFGRLIILEVLPEGHREGVTRCHCRCDCGAEVTVRRCNLARTQSCGCYKTDVSARTDKMGVRQSLLRGYQRSARKKNYAWELTDNEAFNLFQSDCHYCGKPPSTYKDNRRCRGLGSYIFNGIDRVDSLKGYIRGNVVACCPECNYAKRRLSKGDFIEHVQKIHAPQVHLVSPEGITDKATGWAFAHTKANAYQSKREFTLTREQVRQLVSSPCAYCGSSGKVYHGSLIPRNGVDRIDSSQGYIPDNCVPCCWKCNWMKRNHTLIDFLDWVNRVREFQKVNSTR